MNIGYNGQDAAVLITPSRPNNADGGRIAVPTYKPIPTLTPQEQATFWERVAIDMYDDDACWPWKARLEPSGYGRFWVRNKTYLPHRVAWALQHGGTSCELTIDHVCKNRACCNPAHLDLVTMRVNVLRGDGVTARNAVKTHCHRGHEFTPENTRFVPGKGRSCKQCDKEQRQSWHSGKHKRRSS